MFLLQPHAAVAGMLSKDIGCAAIQDARGLDICKALSDNMELTPLGHATVSPGWRISFEAIAKVYCDQKIMPADMALLKTINKNAKDWRLESAADSLLQILQNLDGKGDAPENSIYHPKNVDYILKQGCAAP